jgi:6-phosphogluconolactonase (cycloisomerase 2 family)
MTAPTVATQNNPQAIAIDPSGKWAYVANGGSNCVSQFNIDQTTGELTPMSTPTVATEGYNAWDIRIVSIPSGAYAYVSNYGGNNQYASIAQFEIDQTTGMLSPLAPPTVSAGDFYATSISVHPTGKFAYVTIGLSSPSAVIAQFKIDQTTGVLVSNGTVSAGGTAAASIAIESSGKYAYATSGDSGWGNFSIAQYTIDQTTGALTLMSNPTVKAGYGPSEIVTVGR